MKIFIKPLILLSLFGTSLCAQTDSDVAVDTSLLIEDIVISQNRLSTPLSESARNIQVMHKEEIENLPVTNIPELLQYMGAVDIRRRGVNGVQSDAGIRGSTFNQVLVLVNGVRMSDPQTGHHMMNLPVALEDIERVEVIKGPAARIFGMNAMAGAINIITKQNNKEDFTLIVLQSISKLDIQSDYSVPMASTPTKHLQSNTKKSGLVTSLQRRISSWKISY